MYRSAVFDHATKAVILLMSVVACVGCGAAQPPTTAPVSSTAPAPASQVATAAVPPTSVPSVVPTALSDTATHAASPEPTRSNAVTATAVTAASSAPATTSAPASAAPTVGVQPFPNGPTLLRPGIRIRPVVNLDGIAIKLARNPRDGDLYFLNPVEGIFRVQLGPPGTKTKVVDIGTIFSEGMPAGMAFGPDGTLFVVANRRVEEIRTQAIIRRGLPTDNGYRWETLASTEPYPLSNTNFDHLFNGMLVSPDGQWLYINSGSRTDHGEIQSNNGAFPDTREVALTSKIFRLPTSVTDLLLPNDDEQLAAEGWIFAQGTRNAYDLEWAPNGELFAPDNGPDADYPDELNLVRAGQHYGFPWRFGSQANPQQFPDYDPARDPRLHPDFMAVQTGTYQNDPTFPTAPGTFTDPIANRGPAATQYIGDDGSQRDAASEGQTLTTFTPHRSPLGLVFATSSTLPADLQGTELELSAFVLSWGAAGGSLSDKGQDLLHVRLIPTNAGYQAATQLIARGFKNPIDGVMIDNRLYVLEYNQGGQLWELTFE